MRMMQLSAGRSPAKTGPTRGGRQPCCDAVHENLSPTGRTNPRITFLPDSPEWSAEHRNLSLNHRGTLSRIRELRG
jgi:hypothetical protein